MTPLIIRRLTSLLLLLIFATAMPVMAKEDQIYTIKQGDTLWGLSQRFIDDPYYWPNMWANNPDLTNPHLIFPGQQIQVKDGRLQIIPAYPGAKPAEPATVATPEVITAPTITLKSSTAGNSFILTEEQSLGSLVDSVDNRVLLTKNDLVFLKMQAGNQATVGDTYSLFKRGKKVKHPQTKATVGTMMYNLGYLQVIEIKGDTVTAKIGAVYREIMRGDELFEYIPPREEITLQRGTADLNGYIIETSEEKLTQGSNDVIFIDLGSDDGLLAGNLLYITRPRTLTKQVAKHAGDMQLPDEVMGAAVVIEANRKSSSALIIKSINAMFIGDKVALITN